MDLLASGVLTLYCVLLIVLIIGLVKTRPTQPTEGFEGLISVIVPVRNEAQNVTHVLSALANQTDHNFEVIIVDDHSADTTTEIVKAMLKPRWKLVLNEGIGKKAAITTAVKMARGELVVNTDADCTFASHWLKAIRNSFSPDQAVFTFGAVRMRSANSFFTRIQSIEFASVIGTGMATASLGFPTMCNGANLAFKRSVFERVGGYAGNEHVASGDDEFLMRKILVAHPDGVLFDKSTNRLVTTNAAPNWHALFNQRLRWAGKWHHNKSVAPLLLAFFIVIVQTATLYAMFRIFSGVTHLGLMWSVKVAIDALFIFLCCRRTDVKFKIGPFMLLEFTYPFYVITVGILSNFIKPTWKERTAGV